MAKIKRLFCIILSLSILSCFASCSANKMNITDYFDNVQKISYSTSYNEISEKGKNKTDVWRNSMISGNGLQGVAASGSPYNDTLIYQNMHFIMPNENARTSPDTSAELETVKQNIINGQDIIDNQSYDDVYCFHPGAELRIKQEKHRTKKYFRYTNYETAETGVVYSDKNGQWQRSTFTSKSDDVTITKISQSDCGTKLNLTLSFDEISAFANYGDGSETKITYKKLADENGDYYTFIAHYPDFENSELKNGGYATVCRVICEGGEKSVTNEKITDVEQFCGDSNSVININDADNVYIISASDRTYNMGSFDDFKSQTDFALVNSLAEKTNSVGEKYTENNVFSYENALKAHTDIFTPQFNAVSLKLDGADETLSNDKLLKNQRNNKKITSDLAEKAYYSGRYAYLCSSGVSTPRLYGMWTGEWNGGWGSKYTMDANVNLQTSSMNTSNIADAPVGYTNFILRQVDDWQENARATHGFTDAIQAPVNSDGDMALMTESCYPYPFRYWNAGASWLLQPLYETLQCYGDIQIPLSDEFSLDEIKDVMSFTDDDIALINEKGYLDLKTEVLMPLLIKSANYWQQLLTTEYYTDKDGGIHYEQGKTELENGEYYCIVPSYSPENNPSNYPSPSAANSAIDISACRNNMEMLIDILKSVDENADVSAYQNLIDKLPPYVYDETGALKEWATTAFDENNEHRHLSHLYCVWPLNETKKDDDLQNACIRAIENRESENHASHALVHRALIAARLEDRESVTDALVGLMSSKIYYKSLMTNHHTNRRSAYCTDFEIGYLGIINESLAYSENGFIDLLPSVPLSGFDGGEITGLKTRTRATIDSLKWNYNENSASVTITSDIEQDIAIACLPFDKNVDTFHFSAGETKTIEFDRSKPITIS